jgi:hypothetical protein
MEERVFSSVQFPHELMPVICLVACAETLLSSPTAWSSGDLDRWVRMAAALVRGAEGDLFERGRVAFPIAIGGAGASHVGMVLGPSTSAQLGPDKILSYDAARLMVCFSRRGADTSRQLFIPLSLRDPAPLQQCRTLEAAIAAVGHDAPFGFLHIWLHTPSGTYLVGHAYDFWHQVRLCHGGTRDFAEVVEDVPLSFFMHHLQREEVETVKRQVREQWDADASCVCNMDDFKVFKDEEGRFRLHHHALWFRCADDLRRFCAKTFGSDRSVPTVVPVLSGLPESMVVAFPPCSLDRSWFYPSVFGSNNVVRAVAECVEQRFAGQVVTKCKLEDDCTCTFELARGNLVVADLKQGVFWNDDKGPFYRFPLGRSSLVNSNELRVSDDSSGYFPSACPSAQLLWRFCRAIFAGSQVVLPLDDEDIEYDPEKRQYCIVLGPCPTLDETSVVIRCTQCRSRVTRPSRGVWNLSFLLPL